MAMRSPMTELPKTFDPAAIESRWYAHWEEKGLFRPDRPNAEPWTIVNPPPNVTGSLHIGHALDNTLQDILTRHARLKGKDALWVVGTDHAGIATQMVVERQLQERQQPGRRDIGREKFLEKVWAWKAESGGTIIRQLKRLGASCDWSRERFTMDEGLSKAVLKVFVALYNFARSLKLGSVSLVAPIFRLMVREPARGAFDPVAVTERTSVWTVFGILAAKPSFWLLSFAAAFSSLCGYGLAFWVPSVLIRSFGFSLLTASQYIGSLLLIGGTIGVFAGVSIAGSTIRADRDANEKIYGIAYNTRQIVLEKKAGSPDTITPWLNVLKTIS